MLTHLKADYAVTCSLYFFDSFKLRIGTRKFTRFLLPSIYINIIYTYMSIHSVKPFLYCHLLVVSNRISTTSNYIIYLYIRP